MLSLLQHFMARVQLGLVLQCAGASTNGGGDSLSAALLLIEPQVKLQSVIDFIPLAALWHW